MGNFIKYNRHPQSKTVGDCVVRAISTAFNSDYYETRKNLLNDAHKLGFNHYSDHDFLAKYLKSYEKLSFKAVEGEPRMKLCEFADSHRRGVYVVSVRKHAVAVVNGVILDSWDSSYLTVYNAWKIPVDTTLRALGLNRSDAENKTVRVYL